MKISVLINMKAPPLLAFSYFLAEKISCSAELSTKTFYNLGAWFRYPLTDSLYSTKYIDGQKIVIILLLYVLNSGGGGRGEGGG